MGLIQCPECGKEVSDTVKKCIHCGYKLKKQSRSDKVQGEEKKQKTQSKLQWKKMRKYMLILGVIVILAGGLLLFGWYKSKGVPAFVGMNVDAATELLNQKQISYTVTYEYTEDYDKDVVYGQSIPEGTFYNADEIVALNVSSGRIYKVPDIVGANINDVTEQLGNISYNLVYEYTEDKEEGTILSLSREVGEAITEEEEIEINVSQGTYTVLPDLRGKTEEEVKGILNDLGVDIAIKREVTIYYDEGIVYEYSPEQFGDPSTTTITCTVSEGKGIWISDVVGLEIEKVADKIDVDYQIVYAYEDLQEIDPIAADQYSIVTAQNIQGLILPEDAENLQLEVSKPAIKITSLNFDLNYVGGVDTNISIKNISDKQIAYVTFQVKYYDRMGYAAPCEIKGTSTMNLIHTGPINAGKTVNMYWDASIYNGSCAAIEPLSVKVEFTDGTVQTIDFDGRYWYSNDFYGGALH